MDPVVVVGAGISGVTCARTVASAGLPVTVLDRGHRVGGRMASRTLDGRRADTGASYLTASDPRFVAVVEGWRARGLAREWTDTFTVLDDGRVDTTSGPVRWGTPAGMRSLVEDLALGLDVQQTTVQHVGGPRGSGSPGTLRVDGRSASAVVLAMPDPQARRLLDTGLADEAAALDGASGPVLALVARWPERTWELDGAFVNSDDDLGWVADDGRRRGDGAPVLVAHSTAGVAARYLESPHEATPQLVAALRRLLDLPEPASTYLHRWSFAKPVNPHEEPFLLRDSGIGACGDGWGGHPKVEGAYLSGLALGEALVERLA